MRKHLLISLFISHALAGCGVAWADNTTEYVIDQNLESTAQNIYNIDQQMNGEVRENTVATEGMSRAIQSSLTGVHSTGMLNNPPTDQDFRNWTPSAEDLANMVTQGLQTGSLADRIKYYNEKFKIPTAAQLTPNNPGSIMANYGVFSAVSTNAALSVADKGFDNAQQIQDQLNFLYQELDRQQTLKQSQDLNSVILLKIAALQTDLIRLQSQQLKIQAVSQQENNIKRTTMSQFVEDIK